MTAACVRHGADDRCICEGMHERMTAAYVRNGADDRCKDEDVMATAIRVLLMMRSVGYRTCRSARACAS